MVSVEWPQLPAPGVFSWVKLPFDPGSLRVLLPRLPCFNWAAEPPSRETLAKAACAAVVGMWLYYELCCVTLVCPYYAGTLLPQHLNRFRTVGKVYRPTFYMFAPCLQWMYLVCFCKLMRQYRVMLSAAAEARTQLAAACAQLGGALLKGLMQSFLFTRMFRGQAEVALREFVEAHNGAVVVLDYYLPRWAGTFCSSCGKFTVKQRKPTVNVETPEYQGSHTARQGEPSTPANAEEAAEPLRPRVMFTSDTDLLTASKAPESVYYEVPNRPDNSRDSHSQIVREVSRLADASSRSSDPDDVMEEAARFSYVADSKDVPQKVLRGVIAIIGDVSVSYSVCNQPVNCRCGKPEEPDEPCACQGCARTASDDSKGLNMDAPGFPTLRYLISDAMELGFACVHVHLNVNLGMASEAFPTWTGLRCFPLTLYSDVLLDLDRGLSRIGERYPNLPLCCVGVGFGSNILMEYLALGAAGKAVPLGSDRLVDLQRSAGHSAERRTAMLKRNCSEDQDESNDSRSESEYDGRSSRRSSTKRASPQSDDGRVGEDSLEPTGSDKTSGSAAGSARGQSSGSSTRPMAQCTAAPEPAPGYVEAPAQPTAVPSVKASDPVMDPSYEPFAHLQKVMNDVRSARWIGHNSLGKQIQYTTTVITPREGHFQFDEEAEECTYETSVAYPPLQAAEVIFDTNRISAAVCVNLNLRVGGNALYKSTRQRQVSHSVYGRHCFAAFRHHLVELLREVHCRRANDAVQKECYGYRCCHYARVMARQPWSRRLLSRLRRGRDCFHGAVRALSIEELLLAVHREYNLSYRHMKRRGTGDYTNYKAGIFKRFGARASADFKLSALMTLRYVYSQVGQDNRGRIETVSGPATYRLVNKPVDTNLRIGKADYYGGINKLLTQGGRRAQDPSVCKYLADLINHEYAKNVANIRRNFASIALPTMLLSSLDNALFSWDDVDILDVIKNPNIAYYVSKSGGYSTFLSGSKPSVWFSGPVLEFLDEMSSRCVLP